MNKYYHPKSSLFILGSGRSGTSLVTGLFSGGQYFMGDKVDYLGRNLSNPKGFYEDYEVNTINEDILSLNSFEIPEFIRKIVFPSRTFYRARWLQQRKTGKLLESNNKIRERIRKLTKDSPFCFKDPRFSYTLPVWLESISGPSKFIVVYREPERTANSIVRECQESEPLKRLKMDSSQALKLWLAMYRNILWLYDNSDNKSNWFFLHFEQVFHSSALEKLELFSGAKIDRSFPNKDFSRANNEKIQISKNCIRIYERLNELSGFL